MTSCEPRRIDTAKLIKDILNGLEINVFEHGMEASLPGYFGGKIYISVDDEDWTLGEGGVAGYEYPIINYDEDVNHVVNFIKALPKYKKLVILKNYVSKL